MALAYVALTLVAGLVAMWSAGFFLSERAGTGSEMVGYYRLNAVALINSEGFMSRVLPKIPTGFGDYEGFAYLGLGLMGAAIAAIALAGRAKPSANRVASLLPLGIVLFLLTIFAISMWPAIGKQVIYALPENIAVAALGLASCVWLILRNSTPGSGACLRIAQAAAKHSGVFCVLVLAAAFLSAIATAPLVAFMLNRVPGIGTAIEALRASGRMFWPAYYALLLWIFWVLLRTLAPRIQYLVLGAALALQAWDLSPVIGVFGKTTLSSTADFSTDQDNPLRSPAWHELMAGRERLLVLHPNPKPAGWEALAKLAVEHRASINKAYFSRERTKAYELANATLWSDIEAGRFDPEALYVAYKDDQPRLKAALASIPSAPPSKLIDGFLVVAPALR